MAWCEKGWDIPRRRAEFWSKAHFPNIHNPETEKFDLDVVHDAQNPETEI